LNDAILRELCTFWQKQNVRNQKYRIETMNLESKDLYYL
jgi:hypothetical protein